MWAGVACHGVRESVDKDPEDRRGEGPVGGCLKVASIRLRHLVCCRGCIRSMTERKFGCSVSQTKNFFLVRPFPAPHLPARAIHWARVLFPSLVQLIVTFWPPQFFHSYYQSPPYW